MILFIICAAWILGPHLSLGVLWIQYCSWPWFHVWLLVSAFFVVTGMKCQQGQPYNPDMHLSQTQHYPQTFLSILEPLWTAMYYHTVFCWQMHKNECLGNPTIAFAWIFYVFITEPASKFLYSFYRMTKVALISLQRMIVVVVRNLLCLKSVKQETLLLHYLSNFGGFGLYIS